MEGDVILSYHNCGHPSGLKCVALLNRRFHFGISATDLRTRCDDAHKHCLICQAVKYRRGPRHDTMDFVPIPDEIFSSLCMDFVAIPEVKDSNGQSYDCAFVIVCRLSGYIMAIPCLKRGLTAEKVATLFLERCVALMGIPNEILSDNDHLICSKFFVTLCQLAGIEQHSAIVYRPKGNGRAEIAVKSVIEMLRRVLALSDLTNDLPGVDGKCSPHKIVFGRDPIGFGAVPACLGQRHNASAEIWFAELQQLRLEVQKRISDQHQKLHDYFSKKFKNFVYEPGDRVWVRNEKSQSTVDDKVDTLYTGPCEILKRVGTTGRYTVALPHGEKDVHMDRFKIYLPALDGTKVPFHFIRPRKDVPQDDTYVVEKILDHRIRNGKHQWLVKWKG